MRAPVDHELKCWPEFFWAVWHLGKTFEIRRQDREFLPGDFITLREWHPDTETYTGYKIRTRIGYIMSGLAEKKFGIEPGYCILSLDPAEQKLERPPRIQSDQETK